MAVGSIPAQVMTAGQTVTVDVSPFFSDPDGGALTYTAASSDAGVVSVSLTGSNLTVTAVAAGTATVTVTATDPDGLTATQSAGVTVEAANNNAPAAVGAIPPQTMTAGQTVTVDVSSFFSDPDGDDLTYTAESSDAAVVAVSVEGSSVTVTAVAAGTATVTVTAADPDGLTAAQSTEVTVEEEGAGFRDDFDSDASLDDWELYNASAEVVDGVLHLTGTDSERLGSADRVLETPVTEWVLGTRMARTAADEPAVVYWVTGHDRFPVFRFVILDFDDGDNYWLAMYDGQQESYVSISQFAGNSDAIAEPGGFMDISFSHQNGEFALVVGDTELFRVATSGMIAGFRVSDIVDRVEEVWLGVGSDGDKVLFDWADLTGTEISGRMAGRPEAPGMDSLRGVKDLDHARLDVPAEAISLKKGR